MLRTLACLVAACGIAACAPNPAPAPPETPTTRPEVTCLALGCPGQPPELPGDGPLTP